MNQNKTILVVDDHDQAREVCAAIFRRLGFTAIEAKNGLEGYEAFKSSNPLLVLSDINMPVMGGVELARRIKEESPKTPVVLMTGHIKANEKGLATVTVDLVLEKPVNMATLVLVLQNTVGYQPPTL